MQTGQWLYNGDINIEHGGHFLQLEDEGDDYVLCVDVLPWSEAGGPSNVYLVETGSIYLGGSDLHRALDCIGFDEYGPPTVETAVDALKAYRGMDVDRTYFVQIGQSEKNEYPSTEPDIDQYLSPRTDLMGFVQAKFLN